MNRTGTPQFTTGLGPLNFGNGLVEIGALTTLIGSNAAGDLALGNRGSAGIVWGSITTFGNSSVIKACAGAAMPGWLRYVVGLRTRAADQAVGMDLPLVGGKRGKIAQAVRSTESSGPLGLLSESDVLDDENEKGTVVPRENLVSQSRDALAFNRTTSVMLEELASSSTGQQLPIYMFHPYDFFPYHGLGFQITALGLSLIKLVEAYYLFVLGGLMIGLLSAIPFMFSFITAIIIEMKDIIASRRPMSVDGHVDIVVGTPPTTKQHGSPRKVVLGALKNPKTTLWWKVYYGINAVLQIASLFIYYQLFGQEQIQLVVVWAGFQVAWVTLRTFIFHLTDVTEPMMYRRMTRHDLADLSPSKRLRVLNLVAAVGTYQMHLHPRHMKHYKDDTFSAPQIWKILSVPNIQEAYELPNESIVGSSFQLDIIAVIGDTLLSGATWMTGARFSPMDLYDSCIVVLSLPSNPASGETQSRTISIPSARVFSEAPYVVTDSESNQPAFVPRGAGHTSLTENRCDWIYWIPCGPGLWLHFWSQQQTVLAGRVEAKVVSDRDVSAMLAAGMWYISLKDVQDVKEVVDVSREALNCLLSFVHVKATKN